MYLVALVRSDVSENMAVLRVLHEYCSSAALVRERSKPVKEDSGHIEEWSLLGCYAVWLL
jgi:hypothetical protein